MKIALIGNGGRESALAWKIGKSKRLEKLYVFSKNPGILAFGEYVDIDTNDFEKLYNFLKKTGVNYVVVGPEEPLVNGITDYLEERGIKVFGPNRMGAMIEGSKSFAKEIMSEAFIPTASYRVFTDKSSALDYISNLNTFPIVIKFDGLAGGKGVHIATSIDDSKNFLDLVFDDNKFGDNPKVVVEEFLEGEEVSVFGLTDGKTIKYLPVCQDHKRVFEGDKGPNTGGMGVYGPTSLVNDLLLKEIDEKIFKRLLNTLNKKGIIYKGVIYGGLILTNNGPYVLEFNCRFGDPETQVLMMLIENDMIDIIEAVCESRLDSIDIRFVKGTAICTVLASGGYPGEYKKEYPIYGLERVSSTLFPSGVTVKNGEWITDGGRVLSVVNIGNSLIDARKKVLQDIEKISFEGMHYRKDIGEKEIKRPLVSVFMGSDSDLKIMSNALQILEEFDVPYEINILSAHRTPDTVAKIVKGFRYRNVKVVIAGAGMAAHLPGVIASHTTIPVIGVPIDASLGGVDALYSINQMPPGIPVATVSIGSAGAKNAAILAVEILSIFDDTLKEKLNKFRKKQAISVLQKDKLVKEIGYKKYLDSQKNI